MPPWQMFHHRRSPIRQNLKSEGSQTKPPMPAWVKEYFLPQNYSLPEAFSAAQSDHAA